MIGALAALPTTGYAQDVGIEVWSGCSGGKGARARWKRSGSVAVHRQDAGDHRVLATWCPVCKELEPTWLSAAKKYGKQIKFVGVAVSVHESPERVKATSTKARAARRSLLLTRRERDWCVRCAGDVVCRRHQQGRQSRLHGLGGKTGPRRGHQESALSEQSAEPRAQLPRGELRNGLFYSSGMAACPVQPQQREGQTSATFRPSSCPASKSKR